MTWDEAFGTVFDTGNYLCDGAGNIEAMGTWSYFNGLPAGLSVPGQTLVSNATYHPYGGLSAWTAGNNVTTNIYQDIGDLLPRPVRILAGGFDTGVYAYDGAGNVKAMGSDSFSYDDRSRLTSSTVSLQGLGYGYDRFGNLNPSLVNPGNNRLSAGTYDARGNLTEYAGQRYDYDGLSRQVAYNGGFERYLYDGAGERIARLTSPNPGTDFYTITPCRLLDTRTSPPSLSSTVSRVVQITGGCGVPAEASAVSGNLTVTNVSEQGFLRLFPTGTNPFVNGVSYRAGITRANNFNLGLSGLGRLTLTASAASTADGIVDVSGYYAYPAPTWTLTFRDEANRLSTEYAVTSSTITRTKNYFHFGNLLVSTRDSGGGFLYYASDHLATPRLVTNQGGAAVENHTYHPFGQEITPLFGNQPLKFAAMERDQASGNDSNHARFCSPVQGRFLSPDKVGGKIRDPQTWNRYSYALNNPLKFVDPNGLEVRYADKQLQALYGRLAARYSGVRESLDRYTGADKPDLIIRKGDAGRDPRTGEKALGVTKPTNIIESYQGNWDKITSTKDSLPDTGKYITGATLKETTITIDLSLSSFSNKQANTAVHELGHADSLARDPVSYLQRGANDQETDPKTGKPLDHDARPLEKEANEYRNRVCGGSDKDCRVN